MTSLLILGVGWFVGLVLWFGLRLPRNGPMERAEDRGGDWYGEHDPPKNPK